MKYWHSYTHFSIWICISISISISMSIQLMELVLIYASYRWLSLHLQESWLCNIYECYVHVCQTLISSCWEVEGREMHWRLRRWLKMASARYIFYYCRGERMAKGREGKERRKLSYLSSYRSLHSLLCMEPNHTHRLDIRIIFNLFFRVNVFDSLLTSLI